MSLPLTLPQHEARLVLLALAYHLARPGSEVNRDTLAPVEHGLAEVAPPLEAQLDAPSARLELSAYQLVRLAEAMLGAINELKTYPMLDAMVGDSGRPRSTAPGFEQALRKLFPAVGEDASQATAVAEAMLMLRRRLDKSIRQAIAELAAERYAANEAARRRRRWWWHFWRR